jgi:hypothetical protein
MAARGLPRAGGEGFDFSQRAGEQNLLPFTQFLTDKRKWQDASSEAALRSAGAPVSMLLNVAEGGEKMSNGDIMGGMTQMLPMSLKGPAQAYRMTTDGYIDANGNKLPMTPKATAILGQLVGLTPQAKAEYSEARGDQAAREGVLVNRAKVLRSASPTRCSPATGHGARPDPPGEVVRHSQPGLRGAAGHREHDHSQAQGAGDLAGDADADRHQSEGQGRPAAHRLRQH